MRKVKPITTIGVFGDVYPSEKVTPFVCVRIKKNKEIEAKNLWKLYNADFEMVNKAVLAYKIRQCYDEFICFDKEILEIKERYFDELNLCFLEQYVKKSKED